jgi:hypothetical protein
VGLAVEIEFGEQVDDRPGSGDVELASRIAQDDLHALMFAGMEPLGDIRSSGEVTVQNDLRLADRLVARYGQLGDALGARDAAAAG